MIDERDKEFPTPWTGGEETVEYAIIAPLHSALSNIDSDNLKEAKENILSVLDIIKMKKVSKRFSRFLKIAQEETKVEVPHKAEVPNTVNKYIENKIKAEDYERNDELEFALSSLHSALGMMENHPKKALALIHLAIVSITNAMNPGATTGKETSVGPGTPMAVVQSR